MRILLFFTVLLAFILASCEADAIEKKAPNIVLFVVDDMGLQDTSVPFSDLPTASNELYHTPNMKRLAEEGMKFTQAYATPIGASTRVSLMTGMNAARHQVTNTIFLKDELHVLEKNHATLSFPEWNVNGLSPFDGDENAVVASALPQALHDAGYYTVHVGKAHFGAVDTPGENPLNLGFDVNIAGQASATVGSYLGTENFKDADHEELGTLPGLEKYHGKAIFLTEALTQEALIALDSAVTGEQPFFLHLSHYGVHKPLTADKRFFQKYIDKEIDSTTAKYASMIEGVDKSLGDLMRYLEQKNIEDNTIVLFISDGGGLSGSSQEAVVPSPNEPLSSGKGTMHEGGIRIPMLVKWPELVEPESVSRHQLMVEDFYPTILEMAGIDSLKTIQKVDGESFVSVLEGATYDGVRPIFWHFPNECDATGPGSGAASAVRKGNWKFIYYHADARMELFNLKDDIQEKMNLVKSHPEKVKELATTLTNYLKSVAAQMPLHKKNEALISYPLPILQDTVK